jgi:hypothetical protein
MCAEVARRTGGVMQQLGVYADGRPLNHDEASGIYDLGGVPVGLTDVLAWDAAGQIAWARPELAQWARSLNTAQAPQQPACDPKRNSPGQGAGRVLGGLFGLLQSLFRAPKNRTHTKWQAFRTVDVAGTTYRQDALWRVAIKRGRGIQHEGYKAKLVPEPRNQHDPNAVKVMLGRQHIGYIPKRMTSSYRAGVYHCELSGGVMRSDGTRDTIEAALLLPLDE